MRSTLVGSAIGADVGVAMAGISVYGGDKIVLDEVRQRYITNLIRDTEL